MNRLESLACCRLTEVPRLGTEPGAVGHRESHLDPAAWLAPALAPSLTGAYAAGQPVLVGWIRAVRSGPTRIVLGGDLAGPRPVYPPGSRAEPMPTGWLAAELDALPVWLRCAGRPDALAATPTTERPPPAGGSLDELVAHLGAEPFGWLVFAEPVDRAELRTTLAELHHRIGVLTDRQAGSARDRVRLEQAQDRYRELSRALTTGMWRVHVLAGGADPTAAARTAALLCAASDLAPLPYTLHPAGRPAALATTLAGSLPVAEDDLGASPFTASVELLTAIARPPARELPGIRLVDPPRFDVTPEVGGGIPLGTVLDGSGEPAGEFRVPTTTLNRHAFVAGATGAGKSQTIRHLLEGLHHAGIPWLVIEPAKAEYGRMAGRLGTGHGRMAGRLGTGHGGRADGLVGPDGTTDDGVVVIRPGDPDQVAVSLNPLEPEAGFPLQTHLDLVRALFLAAFEANEPFPQVLARALTDCYEDLGWDLTLGRPRRSGSELRYPNLGDLQRVAADVVDRVGYGAEMTADVRGFVDVRLGSLRLGTPGRFFEGGHPLDVADLLRRNVVLELEDVGNDQDKAFCMGAVLVRLVEHLRVHQRTGPERLRHVTVVEEAHRLLKASAAGTPAAHAVELFAALLAEIRAYGEGVVVAEQIPAKVLPDVVKNTALKVLHRLPAADDRDAVGATMNLDEAQSRHVVTLPPGQAAVFADGMDRPILVRVPLGEDREHLATQPVIPGLRTTRSPTCGRSCRARACTLREIVDGRDLAGDPALVLWIELLTVAHLVGERPPRPRSDARLVGPDVPARTRECALGQLAQQAAESRHDHLRPFFAPEDLARHVAERAAGWLAGDRTWCLARTEVNWQAGRYRWADVGRALAGWRGPRDQPHPDSRRWRDRGLDLAADTIDGQLALLRAHPTRRVPGRALLFGCGLPDSRDEFHSPHPGGVLEAAVNALGRAVDPATRLARAAAFLDPEDTGWLTTRLLPRRASG